MGELIAETVDGFDPFKTLTWEKILYQNDHHISLQIKTPKVSELPSGIVCDIFTYHQDPAYCPVVNFKILVKMKGQRGKVDVESAVFVRKDGKLITHGFVNDLMESLLRPFFPDFVGKWTCHSFRGGIVSDMAANPEVFTEEDTKLAGGWNSNTVGRYTRLTGQGRERVTKKYHDFLRYLSF